MIIFTDLDGTLLNREDYSFAAARPSIGKVKEAGIPLIFVTSKTRPEVEQLQREMAIRDPFIVENGGGIFFPRGYRNWSIQGGEPEGRYTAIRLGASYSAVRNFIKTAGAGFAIRAFGDMSPEAISKLTGLSRDRAEMALRREFTEPFLLEGRDDIHSFSELAAAKGLKVVQGGRFYHLMGKEQDKGAAVRLTIDLFRTHSKGVLRSIGLGDSENDLPMLEAVDIPVLIPRPGKGHLGVRLPGLVQAKETGCRGWNEAMEGLLKQQEKPPPIHAEKPGGDTP